MPSFLVFLFAVFVLSTTKAQEKMAEQFLEACKNGDEKKVSAMISAENVLAQNADGKTGLLLAVENGHCEVVRVLLNRRETNQDARTKDGSTATIIATERNYYPCLEYLLRAGMNANVDLQRNDGNRAIHLAAKFNRLKMAQLLVEKGNANLETRTEKDETPLLVAAEYGSSDVALYLIDKGADVTARSRKLNSRTTLNWAAEKGLFELVRRVVEKGAILESGNDGTPLTLGLLNKQFDIAFYLINKGADTNAVDPNTNQPLLYIAAKNGADKLIEPLLTRGADRNWKDSEGKTPLLVAVANGNCEDVVKRLCQTAGVNVNARQNDGSNGFVLATDRRKNACLKILADAGVDKDVKRNDGETALHIAVGTGEVGLVKDVANCRPDFNVRNSLGYTPFFKGLANCKQDAVQFLSQFNPNVVDPRDSANGDWQLTSASICNYVSLVKTLLDKGADINAKAQSRQVTALMAASEKGNLDVVKLLVERKADIRGKASSANGGGARTALHFAAPYVDVVKYLLANGADIEGESEQDGTLMHLATWGNYSQTALFLIERGAEVNKPYRPTGNTPLIYAVNQNNLPVAAALLLRGANINAKNNKGETAINFSKSKEMTDFLISKGATPNAVIGATLG